MRRMLTILLLSALVPGVCLGQDETKPQAKPEDAAQNAAAAQTAQAKEILKQAQEALKQAKVLRYEGKYVGTGWVKQYVPDVEGSAIIGEASEYDLVRFCCDVKLTPAGTEEVVELSAGCDGELYFLTDPKVKTVYADIDDAVLGPYMSDLRRFLLPEFLADEPLAAELAAADMRLAEPEKLESETCRKVVVKFPNGRSTVWYFAKKDALPRRVDRFYPHPQQGEASTSFTMSKVSSESKFSLEPFKVKVPEGYTRTDDFPPAKTTGGP